MYIVEVVRASEGLAGPMARMRTWLDHQQVQPAHFEFAFLPNRMIRFRLQFRTSAEAAAFAGAFGGEVLSSATGDALAA
jgi:hypothetical protein